jgi:predicted RNA-binding protein with PUA-like domain
VNRWIFLADPTSYGWSDLLREKRTLWDGVTNPSAQRRISECRKGDEVLIYHTAPDKAIVGTARITGDPRPDPKKKELVVVEVEPVAELERSLPLQTVRADSILQNMGFVKMPRVAVHAVTEEEWDRVMELTRTDPGTAVGTDPANAGGP